MKRIALLLISVALVLPALSSCGSSDNNEPDTRQVSVDVLEATGDANSLRYKIQVSQSGSGREHAPSAVYICEYIRHPGAGAEIKLSAEGGETLVTARRLADGSVRLTSATGLNEQSASGALRPTPAALSHLSGIEWACLDSDFLAGLPVPAGLEELRTWKEGLNLVNAFEPQTGRAATRGRCHCYTICLVESSTGKSVICVEITSDYFCC